MHLVSVIIPCHNSQQYVVDSINSVLNQTYKNWEIIIVDDKSVDGTIETLGIYSKQKNIHIIKNEINLGAAQTRNTAIKHAKGRFIAFLDSDDLWLPTKLEKQISFMLENEVALSYTAYEKIDENGLPFQTMQIPAKVSYSDLLKTNIIGCLTAVYDTEKLGKVYMPTNNKREDFLTWLSILKKVDYAYGIQEVLAQYRVYNHQSSAKKMNMAKENWRLYHDIENLGILKSLYYFSHYAVRGVIRNKLPSLAKKLNL